MKFPVDDVEVTVEDKLAIKLSVIADRVMQTKQDAFIENVGSEGCLTGDTIINTNRAELGRTYSIKQMYEKFNGLPQKGQGKTHWDLSIPTFIRAFNGKEIRLHRVKNVIYSGKKKVFLLKLQDGKTIKATANGPEKDYL